MMSKRIRPVYNSFVTRDVEAEAEAESGSWKRKRWKRFFFCGSDGSGPFSVEAEA